MTGPMVHGPWHDTWILHRLPFVCTKDRGPVRRPKDKRCFTSLSPRTSSPFGQPLKRRFFSRMRRLPGLVKTARPEGLRNRKNTRSRYRDLERPPVQWSQTELRRTVCTRWRQQNGLKYPCLWRLSGCPSTTGHVSSTSQVCSVLNTHVFTTSYHSNRNSPDNQLPTSFTSLLIPFVWDGNRRDLTIPHTK